MPMVQQLRGGSQTETDAAVHSRHHYAAQPQATENDKPRSLMATAMFRKQPQNRLRYGLGALWLIAALLQMQPGMFHPAFYGNLPSSVMPSVLQTIKESTVPWAQPAISTTQALFIHLPVVTNGFIILMQLALAAGMLLPVSRRVFRLAAFASLAWGILVWIFGEGLSGLFSLGAMNFYEGFPGSALLYAFAGFLLLLPTEWWVQGRAHRIVTKSVASVLLLSALLQLWPANEQWTVKGQLDVFANSGFQHQPSFMSSPIMGFTMWITAHPVAINAGLTLLLLISAAFVYKWHRLIPMGQAFVYLVLGFAWWFGQDFGYLFSGLSTDLNSAPAFALLLYAASKNETGKRSEPSL